MGKPKEEIIFFENDDSWHLEVAEFFNAITNNKIKNGSSNDAVEIMKIIDAVYKE